jgi:hypothetical protein
MTSVSCDAEPKLPEPDPDPTEPGPKYPPLEPDEPGPDVINPIDPDLRPPLLARCE